MYFPALFVSPEGRCKKDQMALYDPYLAVRRFGTGLSPNGPVPADAGGVLADLDGPDTLRQQFEVPPIETYQAIDAEIVRLRKAKRVTEDPDEMARLDDAAAAQKAKAAPLFAQAVRARIARGIAAPIGFRERLEWFWADHFTVRPQGGISRRAVSTYWETAIRPNVSSHFAQMLRAVAMQPLMLGSLDQNRSSGPNSRFAKERGEGLNENYAREMIELHTLGADGSYSQRDVVELARILAGLGIRRGAFEWQLRRVEPGEKRFLGKVYGSDAPKLEDVFAAFDDLALHPDTARHLARKLAVHFISDTPDPGLVRHMAGRYRASDGDLTALYAAMLEHPAAWKPFGSVKWPFEYLVSGLKALGVPPERVMAASRRDMKRGFYVPMRLMGQTYQRPTGPDGWAEADSAWITPQGIAGRIQWAMNAPASLLDELPDPRRFLTDALGPSPTSSVRFAAFNAESQREGVGIVLASSAFQRR